MNTRPLVSVCIPAYNRPDYLAQAIQSVLTQKLEDWELVISDDSSPQDLTQCVARFSNPRIRFFRQKYNLGMTKNWNAVLTEAKGKYIKLLMDDDVLEPDCLQEQVAVLDQDQRVAVVCANYTTINEHGAVVQDPAFSAHAFRLWEKNHREWGHSFILSYLLGQRRVGLPSAILFRKEDQMRVGEFLPQAGAAADIDMWLRLCERGDFFYLDSTLLKMRMHEGNLLKALEASNEGYRDVLYIYQSAFFRHRNNVFFRLRKSSIRRQLEARLAPFIDRATPDSKKRIIAELSRFDKVPPSSSPFPNV